MNLFVINRYEDDEWKKESTPQDHLSDLLKRIAERKRERETAVKDAEEVEAKAAKKLEDVLENVDEFKSEIETKKGKHKKGKKRKLKERKETLNETISEEVQSKNKGIDESGECGINGAEKSIGITQEGFTILGSKKRLKSQIAKRVLPHWLRYPEIVPADLNCGPSLDETKTLLDSTLTERLRVDGFNKLFPVQFRMLEWLLKCNKDYRAGRWVRDTCISMPTGSGKTLAYALPIIKILQHSFVRLVRCLIVLPVQELATQVYDVFVKYSNATSLRVALISGASSFKEEQEKLVKIIENGKIISQVDIVVATPGRLVDHIRKTVGFSLSALRFLVIDEADRATDWLQYIPFPHSKAPFLSVDNMRSKQNTPAQKLLLSATLSQDPEKLSRLGLFRPILFTSAVVDLEKLDKDLNLDEDLNNFVSCYGNPNELTERIVQCSLQEKPLALYNVLLENKIVEKTLIFTNSCDAAHRLAILLQSLLKSENVAVGELSAKLGSKQREEILEKFIKGTVRVLVSSDALARGLDIPCIKLVVSYELPKHIKGYIHRAGRTGRGGIPGTAVSLLLPSQVEIFNRMLKKVGKAVPVVEKENLEDLAKSANYESHLETLKAVLIKEQNEKLCRLKLHKRANKM